MSTALQERQIHHYESPNATVFGTIDFRKAELGQTIGSLSFDPTEADRLRQLDDTQKRAELTKNLEGFKGEVLDDVAVSHRYHYYFDEQGNVYNHPDRQHIHRFEHQFDPRERDGLPSLGFKRATQMMLHNPNKTVLWYSPPGEASQDKSPDNPYADVTFIYGQLYVMSYDGNRVSGVAVKVDREGEDAIDQFMPDRFYEADKTRTDYERIQYFLENPAMLNCSVEELSKYDWVDGRVYGGKGEGRAKQNFTVHAMLRDIKVNFSNTQTPSEISALVRGMSSAQLEDRGEIAKLYLQMILNHSSMQKDGKISLQGACGGSIVERNTIEALLGMKSFEPVSSPYRLLTQGNVLKDLVNTTFLDKYKTHHEDYNCPGCNATLSGESITDKKSWRKKCEHCGHALGC